MSIMAIFANSPFDNEIRMDCKMLRMNTKKDGEVCVLPNFNNSIFEIDNSIIFVSTDSGEKKIKIDGVGIIKFENNILTCFGKFTEI